ncbi:DUF5074 domain-containing protein [Chitinophaga nivalis]|uniref:DUF5074 domain-containing protein n=1 Tax=Chitinophaga nivalis TaxID=2991709 RepID=A0ABT3IS12_9BACT|nr:DUF5074 domain-containing protein [Chitinophaga nivalis]MCW3463775.1 DUF5074 domain-containing protein [Chitinophaga nivalis]MCW3486535.1 DUF5074 domain-containing protein [Chitinophaga nivalis]
MKKQLFSILAAGLILFAASCKKEDALSSLDSQRGNAVAKTNVTNALVTGKYANGFFIANEGWFGHGTGDLHFYSYSGDSLVYDVYHQANPTGTLGGAANTLQYATIFNGKLYIVVKAGGPLVVTDAGTLVETGRITTLPGNDGHAFIGVDASRGLLSASDGVYPVSLPSLAVGTKVAGVSGYTGDLLKIGSRIFVLSESDGIVALNSTTYAVVKKFGAANLAFAAGKDGAVYATNTDSIIRIDPVSLARTAVKLPFAVPSPWGAWRHAAITSSTQENAIYIVRNNGFAGGTQLYRYIPGTPASLSTPFITLPTGQYFYGAGAAYNKAKNELVITTLNGAYTGNINRVLIYDATTATLKKTLTYNGWFFPAMPVFHE